MPHYVNQQGGSVVGMTLIEVWIGRQCKDIPMAAIMQHYDH